MDYRLEDLIDIPLFQRLQDELDAIYSFPSAIIGNDGRILTATAWQDVCTKFYRADPLTARECVVSDRYIASHLSEASPAVSYTCPHGLVDNAIPIIIGGKPLGNFFTGQLFLGPPDLPFFRAEAKEHGFDEETFLLAVAKVPVWSREKLDRYLSFIKTFTEILAGIGYRNLQEIEARRLIAEKNEEVVRALAATEAANRALARSESRFRSVFENSQDAIGISREGISVFMNPAYLRLFGYEREEELVGHPILEQIAPSAREMILDHVRRRAAGEAVPRHYGTVGLRKDGSEFPIEVGVDRYESDGEMLTIAIIRDITERRRSAEVLEASLREKEMLLKELYHRTKNNMNIIASFLELEAMYADDPAFTDLVKRTMLRIQAMSLVHQKLYIARDLSHIELGDYLRDLVRSVARYCAREAREVSLDFDLGSAEVSLDAAIPCGLVVNELVVNAFRHAFGDRPTGAIRLAMTKDPTGEIRVVVSDDGMGIADADGSKMRLGLATVHEIVQRQLKGSVSRSGPPGLSWEIRFRDPSAAAGK